MALSDFPRHVIRRHPGLVGRRVVVALSGGADSVALLHLLRAPQLRLELVAVHVHHGVRGGAADDDAAFCERLCGELSVPFEQVPLATAPGRGEGRESDWRRRRYAALRTAAVRLGAAAVATGHHRDDVAEGVLMQLLRGAGPRALAGIHAATRDDVVRPLLPWTRREIESWLTDHGLSWREDATNRSDAHLRNVVRHRLLPLLEQSSPQLAEHLVRLAGALSEDERFLSEELARRAVWIDPWHPDGGVPASTIASLPAALRVRWLHAQAERLGVGRATRRQRELLDELLDRRRPGAAVTLAGRWRLRLVRDRLWAEPPSPPQPTVARLSPGDDIALCIPGWRIRLAPVGAADARRPDWRWQPPPGVALAVRGVRAGDRVPAADGPARASRLLAAALPRHLRQAWPVVVADDTIAWIPGVWTNPDAAQEGPMQVEVARS